MLASVLLALTLGQACPEPPSRNGPPPCAAANVPGCLPGYRPSRDDWGRRIYVCDPAYWGRRAEAPAPQAPPPEAPQQYAPPAAPQPPPQQYAQPAPSYAPPAYREPPPPAWRPGYDDVQVREERRGQLAFVFLPGISSATGLPGTTSSPLDSNGARSDGIGALALEIRGQRGGARLRLMSQWTSFGHIADATLKYDLVDVGPIRPFLGVGVGAAAVDPDTDWRACGSIVGGVDLYLSKNVFLTAELQGRRFSHRTAVGGLEETSVKQAAALFGLGIYL